MNTKMKKMMVVALSCAMAFVGFADDEQTEAGFQKAFQEGRYLAAERIYRVIGEKKGLKPMTYYQAALISSMQGKDTLYKDRLSRYLRAEPGWTAEKRIAAWNLTRRTIDASAYLELMKNEKPSPALRDEGLRLIRAFREAKRPAEVMKVADAYLAKFTEYADKRDAVLPLLQMSWENQPNYSVKQAVVYAEKYPLNGADINQFIGMQRGTCNGKWCAEYMVKNGELLLPDNFWWAFGNLHESFLDKDRKLSETAQKARDELAKKCFALEDKLPKDNFDYQKTMANMKLWYRHCLGFSPATSTNQYAQLCLALVDKLAPLAKEQNQKNEVINFIWGWGNTPGCMTSAVLQQLRAKYEKDFFSNHMKLYWEGGAVALANAQKSAAPILAMLNKYPNDTQLAWEVSDHLCRYGEVDYMKKYMADYARRDASGRGDTWLNWLTYIPTNKMPVEAKAAFMLETAKAVGSTPMFKWMVEDGQIKRWKKDIFGYKAFDPVVQQIRAGFKLPPLRALRLEIQSLKRESGNKCPARAMAIIDETLKLYPERYPMAGKTAEENADYMAIWGKFWYDLGRSDGAVYQKLLKVLPGRMWEKFDGNWMWELMNHRDYKPADRKIIVDEALVKNPNFVEYLANTDTYVYPSNTVALPQPFTLKNISAAGLMRLTGRFRPFFAPKFISEIFTEFYKNRNVWDEYKNYPWDAHNRFWEAENQLQDGNWALLKDKAFIDSLPWDAMAERCLTSNRGIDREMNFLIIAYRYGRGPEMKKRYLEYLKTCDARYRFEAVRCLLGRGEIIRCADGRNLPKEKDEYWPFVRDWYLPYFKGLSNADALLVDLGEQRDEFYGIFCDVPNREIWRNDKDVQALISELSREYVRLSMAGMRGGRRPGCPYARVFDEDLASGQNQARLPMLVAVIARDVEIGREKAQEWVKKLQEKELWEVLFVLTGALQNLTWWGQEAANGFAKVHASITSKIPGIYPVTEKDPAYPLYVAADEYSQSAHEKAWELLKKNVTVFERVAGDLPPEFTAWALEQLLRDRGEKDANLNRARDIATRLLQNEGKLTPDFAASLLLIRAESYRTQQNFEAAKLEYQSIRDNPAYHATPSGKKAMFRATDLQIDAGNIEGVEQTLEYWLSQNDREVVAQAHYFLAKIAFSRKDYDETIKQLRQVFAINFTHVEGRFLQGQWKLATNNEVDDTEVLIGDLSERSFIRPGNQLTVTVQDANLNVAGGGASIPVIVTTKPGGDWERMNLYQSVRDPQCFKGAIDIELGKANPSNLTVQVRGDDIVSYTIDPKFLAERGLAPQPTKSMRVVDDGKLAIGAGAPKASEKKTEKTVKDLLEHTDSKAGAVARALRPGNPFYVMVKDRDCSFGGSNDEVRVTVTTSSGDKIEGFTLLEEKPFTGVFRGRVTTALPPPRAFASDTATGFNPGDVINSRRDGGWQSLSDSQPGKWFAVDTMGAHIFSNITMATKSLVDIPSVKLTGLMGGKTIALGSLPKADTKSRIGLHRQIAGAMKASRIEERRAYFENNLKNFPDGVVSNLTFRLAEKNPQPRTFYYHGAFMQPEGVEGFRMRIVPVTEGRDSLRGASLTVLVDDTVIFDGWDTKLANALVGFDFLAGCHKLEVFASVAGRNDEFDLLFDEDGQELKPMPQEWFDVVKYPEIKEFVKDFADIVKTNGCLVANFVTPIRLRTFKWEFVGVKTPYVSVDGISATNDKGEKILPVETDFSDSLNNDTLEVAPGDRITVRYDDQRTSSGHKKSMQAGMNSQFNDGSIGFFFEEVGAGGGIQRYEALRYQPGDSLVIQVKDPDLDVSDDADTVDVKLVNIDGKEIVRTLTEVGGDDEKGVHTGVFMSLLKTCHESDTNATAKVLRTRPTDILTISYDDRENTSPGVPFLRKALITATKVTEPTITLFNTRKHKVIDNSQRAQDELARIRHRPGNENVKHLYTNVLVADPMTREESDSTNAWPVCLCAGVPVRINDRSRARHRGSFVTVEAVAHSELARAKAENREPAKVRATLGLGGGVGPFRLVKGQELPKVAEKRGTFNGFIPLSLGPIDLNVVSPNEAKKMLCVTGSDQIDITLLDPEGKPCLTRTVKLVTDGEIGLVDSTFNAERSEAHIGEYFYVKVNDADRDATDEPDRIRVDAVSSNTGVRRPLILTETMPHSGIFTGRVRPVIFNKGETIPNVCTGGVATVREAIAEDRFAIDYGDSIIFKYKDDVTLPSTPPRTLSVTGTVFRGANGSVRTFSKHFSDRDSAVLVQFRLAECLFEQAKEHRKLKQPEKSAAAIADGKFLLEEALKNFPDSSHIVQGEFLLANLYQELGSEQKEAGNMEKAIPLFQDALSRFAQILGTWPDGEFAARSQYHKAYCLEMLQDYNRAAEEYVKMTYLFPESELVGEATIRLATYYYVKVKRYDIAGHIYRNFQQRFPQHDKAARALFMAGSCYIKQAQAAIAATKPKDKNTPVNGEAVRIAGAKADEMYREAYKTFMTLIDTYRDAPPAIRAQTMYWAGDVGCRAKNYAGAYRNLKRVIFEYPETEWARRARGLLLQEAWSFKNFE